MFCSSRSMDNRQGVNWGGNRNNKNKQAGYGIVSGFQVNGSGVRAMELNS